MQPRLTRGEYWILETVVEMAVPLCFLATDHYDSPDGIAEMFNKTGHGLDDAQLLATLAALFEKGWIEATREGEPTALNTQQLSVALKEPGPRFRDDSTYYQLTQEGGATWEAFAAPEWDRYLLEELYRPDDSDHAVKTGTVTCSTSWRVEKYLKYFDVACGTLIQDSIVRENLGPWNATYWKQLPSGTRATFCWREMPDDSAHASDEYWLAFAGFCQFREEWCHWR